MTYSKAIEILGFTTPRSLEFNAELAKTLMSVLTLDSPLRYKVACRVLIEATQGGGA